jgi:Leucine-rich repeat (LRR) protein
LRKLDCFSNQLTELDLRENKGLKRLYCDSNQLTELDVRENKELRELDCDSNQLTELDVRENKELRELDCDSNQLTELDVKENKELKWVDCRSNFLTLANCQEIEKLGINDLEIYPQYPPQILSFLKKLHREEPTLSQEEAKKRVKEYMESEEVQSKLVEGKIELPDEDGLNRLVEGYFQ